MSTKSSLCPVITTFLIAALAAGPTGCGKSSSPRTSSAAVEAPECDDVLTGNIEADQGVQENSAIASYEYHFNAATGEATIRILNANHQTLGIMRAQSDDRAIPGDLRPPETYELESASGEIVTVTRRSTLLSTTRMQTEITVEDGERTLKQWATLDIAAEPEQMVATLLLGVPIDDSVASLEPVIRTPDGAFFVHHVDTSNLEELDEDALIAWARQADVEALFELDILIYATLAGTDQRLMNGIFNHINSCLGGYPGDLSQLHDARMLAQSDGQMACEAYFDVSAEQTRLRAERIQAAENVKYSLATLALVVTLGLAFKLPLAALVALVFVFAAAFFAITHVGALRREEDAALTAIEARRQCELGGSPLTVTGTLEFAADELSMRLLALECAPADTTADPHVKTIDGLAFDFQAAGEFVLTESTAGERLTIQVRQRPVASSICPNVAINTAVAARVGGHRITVDVEREAPLWIDGRPADIPGNFLSLDGRSGILQTDRNAYVIIWADGTALEAWPAGSHLNVQVSLPDTRRGQTRGLLGRFNGDTRDDIHLRQGRVLDQPTRFEDLYGIYAESWRISAAESLFDYEDGEGTETYSIPGFPSAPSILADLPQDLREAAQEQCQVAGVTNPIILDDCTLDVACTGDLSYIESHTRRSEPTEALVVLAPGEEPNGNGQDQDPDARPVDFTNWRSEGPGNWRVSEDGRSVDQASLTDPTFFVGAEDQINATFRGTFNVPTRGTNYVGLIVGYQAPLTENDDPPETVETLLISWKGTTSTHLGAEGPEGFTLARVSGTFDDWIAGFWDQQSSPAYQVLATRHGSGQGWQREAQRHDFEYELAYTDDRIMFSVEGHTVFDVSQSEAGVDFEAGRFGFYAFRQAGPGFVDTTVSPRITPTPRPGASIEMETFSTASPLRHVGSAAVRQGALQLTPSERHLAGATWFEDPVHVIDGFETEFDFRITDPLAGGGEGLALVIHNSPDGAQAIGAASNHLGYGGIENALAIEFDTLQNEHLADPEGHHVAIMSGGISAVFAGHPGGLGDSSLGEALLAQDLLDGELHRARIVYVPDPTNRDESRLTIFLDGAEVLSIPFDFFFHTIDLADGRAYIGLTASTGEARATHEVLRWSIEAP